MSVDQAKACLAKLSSDDAFRKSVEGAGSDDARREVIKDAGFNFSQADMESAMGTGELDDSELENVAGGSTASTIVKATVSAIAAVGLA